MTVMCVLLVKKPVQTRTLPLKGSIYITVNTILYSKYG